MTSFSILDSSRTRKSSARTMMPHVAPVSATRERMTDTHSHLLPAQPAAIPVEASPPLPLQRQLSIGSASDPLEAEADAMAAHVLGGRPAGATAGSATPKLRRQAANAIQPVQAPPIVHQALNSPGQPLDSATAAFMQPRFGSDLGGVRIHNGPQAAEAAEAVQANAYTVGQDIVFGAGRYKPNSHEGKRLLAHELSHTVQQSGGGAGARLSKAPRGVYRDGPANAPKGTTTDTDTKKPKTEQAPRRFVVPAAIAIFANHSVVASASGAIYAVHPVATCADGAT
jgi:hypothetical protein